MSEYDVVLFDLDGTISDSARSIISALRGAFDDHGLPRLDAETEMAILGPPFHDTLPPFIGSVGIQEFIDSYRARYVGQGGMFDTEIFEGVGELLARTHRAGLRLALATSKPQVYAAQIVEHLGLADYFEVIGGDALDGSRNSKALVIEDVLQRLGGPQPSSVLMVGDREHDVLGARAHGIETTAVRWGYARAGELEAVAPLAIVETPSDLAVLLGLDLAA